MTKGMLRMESAVPLELKGRDPLLVTGQEEDSQEPHSKRDAGSMEYRPRGDRALIPANTALFETLACG